MKWTWIRKHKKWTLVSNGEEYNHKTWKWALKCYGFWKIASVLNNEKWRFASKFPEEIWFQLPLKFRSYRSVIILNHYPIYNKFQKISSSLFARYEVDVVLWPWVPQWIAFACFCKTLLYPKDLEHLQHVKFLTPSWFVLLWLCKWLL